MRLEHAIFCTFLCWHVGGALAVESQRKPEPAALVNPQGRDEEPVAERAWISANFPVAWVGRPPFEAQLDQSYYYADEESAHLLLRFNTQNLVRNGTFERDTWRRGWPDDWDKDYWEKVRRHHLRPRDPTSICLRLGEGRHWVQQQVGGIKVSKKHVLTFLAKTEPNKSASYEITWDGKPRSATGVITQAQFKQFKIEFTPQTDKPVVVRFWSGKFNDEASGGIGYFRHVRLHAIPDGSPKWPFSAAEAKSLGVRITLFREWAGESRLIKSTTVRGFSPDTTLTKTISLAGLPTTRLGRSFRLVAEVVDASGNPATDAAGKPLKRVLTFGLIQPPRQVLEPIKKIEWRDNFACFVNDKPFFPIMLYNWYGGGGDFTERDWRVDMPEMRKMGFNTVYLADNKLDLVKKHNLYYLLSRPAGYVEKPLPKQGHLKTLQNARKNYGEWLLAYADGVEHPDSAIPHLQRQYAKDKSIDASRPVIQCVQGPVPTRHKGYAKAADVLWVEPHTHHPLWVVNYIETAKVQARAAGRKKFGVWCELATYSPFGPPQLDPVSLRERAWAALTHGISGIDWFAHHAYEGGATPNARTKDMAPLTWSELRGLLAEIQYLTPALCAPEHPGIKVTPDMVDVTRRDVDGKIYVIASPSYWYFKSALGKPDKVPYEHWQYGWTWQRGPQGKLALKMELPEGGHSARWYFFGKLYNDLARGDKLIQEVYVEPESKLESLEINHAAYTINGDYYRLRGMTRWIPWNDFACWGTKAWAEKASTASRNNPRHRWIGNLPPAGRWTTLEVDAADVQLVGDDITHWHHGRRFLVNAKKGAPTTVWWGRSLIRRSNGELIETFGPTPDDKVTFTVTGLKPTSKVISLLDGRVLAVEGSSFRDKLFEVTEHWLSNRQVRIYEITP